MVVIIKAMKKAVITTQLSKSKELMKKTFSSTKITWDAKVPIKREAIVILLFLF